MEQAALESSNTGQMADAASAPALPSAVTSTVAASPPPAAAPAAPAAVSAPAVPVIEPVAAPAPAVREDQVQNAVGFLSHPQVRSSTNTASKRSFLERKGLNAAEIDEAFRRVPEAPPQPAPAPVAPPPVAAAPAPQPAAYASQPAPQAQQLVAAQQPYATAPGTQLVAVQPAGPAALMPQVPQTYRWSQIVLGVGAVVAAGWAVHQLVLPRLRSLVDSWQAQRREAEEARHKELHTAVASLKGCQEELRMSTQALLEAVNLMREQQRGSTVDGVRGAAAGRPAGAPPRDNYYQSANGRNDPPYGGPGAGLLGSDNYASLRAAAGYTNAYPPDPPSYTVSYNYGRGGDSGPATAGATGGDGGGRGGSSAYGSASNPPYGVVRSAAANPYGGPGAGGAGQPQQENLPYRVTAPPSPAHSTHSLQSGRPQQQPMGGLSSASGPYGSSDRLYDPSMPGGTAAGGQGSRAGGSAYAPTPAPAASAPAAAAASGPDGRTVPRPPPEQPVYPQSFHEVMEMVQQGITPPNVRTDINDSPPDPTRPFSEARIPAPPKPWERAAAAGSNGSAGLPAGSSAPYGITAPTGKPNGMPYSWESGPSAATASPSASLSLPPTSYGIQSAAAVGGAAGASGSAAAGSAGAGSAGRGSNSGSGDGGGVLTVLPPANPLWRPPPPPLRTVVSSNPPSPPSTLVSGMAAAAGEAAPAAAAAAASAAAAAPPPPRLLPPAAALAAEVPEPVAALAGPPSPSPSQPAFAASATELNHTPDGPSAYDTPVGPGPGTFAAGTSAAAAPSPLPRPPPPPPAPVAVASSAEGSGGAAPEPASPSASAAPGITTP